MFDELMRLCGFQNSTARLFHTSLVETTLPELIARRRPKGTLTMIQLRSRILYNRWKHQLHSLIDIECGYTKIYHLCVLEKHMQLFIATLMSCNTSYLIYVFVHV